MYIFLQTEAQQMNYGNSRCKSLTLFYYLANFAALLITLIKELQSSFIVFPQELSVALTCPMLVEENSCDYTVLCLALYR